MKRRLLKTTSLTATALVACLALACSGGSDDPSTNVDEDPTGDNDAEVEDEEDDTTDVDDSNDDEMDIEAQGGMGGDGGDDPDEPEVPDEPVTPEIVSSFPADGDVGFLYNDSFVVKFSVPMDTSSVEASYLSVALPPEDVTFSWNEDATELTIDPLNHLEFGTGTNPEDVALHEYDFTITADASSAEGETLANGLDVTFTTARRIIQYLVPVASLSGATREGGYETNTINAGDSGVTENEEEVPDWWYIGLLSFDLTELPGEIVEVNWAQLGLTQAVNNGTPFDVLGGQVDLYDVSFSERNFDQIQPQLSSPLLVLSDSAADTDILVNVGAQVAADFEAEAVLSQFAMTFPTGTDDDGLADSTVYTDVSLKVNYFIE